MCLRQLSGPSVTSLKKRSQRFHYSFRHPKENQVALFPVYGPILRRPLPAENGSPINVVPRSRIQGWGRIGAAGRDESAPVDVVHVAAARLALALGVPLQPST